LKVRNLNLLLPSKVLGEGHLLLEVQYPEEEVLLLHHLVPIFQDQTQLKQRKVSLLSPNPLQMRFNLKRIYKKPKRKVFKMIKSIVN
jgi:hypothetical protein